MARKSAVKARRAPCFDPRIVELVAVHMELCTAEEHSTEERRAIRRKNALIREMKRAGTIGTAILVGGALRRMAGAPFGIPC